MEKEREKGGVETREIGVAGFVDPAVRPQKDEICFHFHLWQSAKVSSGPISSLTIPPSVNDDISSAHFSFFLSFFIALFFISSLPRIHKVYTNNE